MKRVLCALLLTAGFSASTALADVTSMNARFAGGCIEDNENGTCTIKVAASGTDLDSETAVVFGSDSANGDYRRLTRARPLSSAGQAVIKVKNIPGGCYIVRTGPNGNDKPDRATRQLCEVTK